MSFLKLLGSILVRLLKAITIGGSSYLIDILKRFWEALKGFLRFLRQHHPEHRSYPTHPTTVGSGAWQRTNIEIGEASFIRVASTPRGGHKKMPT